jgi:hypothetical protein
MCEGNLCRLIEASTLKLGDQMTLLLGHGGMQESALKDTHSHQHATLTVTFEHLLMCPSFAGRIVARGDRDFV